MRVAIHQPNYLPYPGFFAKACLCDVFVMYDSAQFIVREYMNRNKIRTYSQNGWMWLTLPVPKDNYVGVPIVDVEISPHAASDNRVFIDHSETLRHLYTRAPYFDKEVCTYVSMGHKYLADHNIHLLEFLFRKLGIKAKIVRSSSLRTPIRHRTLGIIDIVKALSGTQYISGTGAKAYMDEKLLREESIGLSYIAYKPLAYPQFHPGFVENMSIIDMVFNIGWEETSSRLKGTGFEEQ